jgi:flagellar M-ring protein FliF
MTGIEHASVQLAEYKTNGLRPQTEVTAAVAIMPSENTELEPERVTSIRDFVAAAIPGLKATNVTVMDMNAGYSYPGGGDDARVGARSDYASQKRSYEQEWRRKITELLGYIPGVKVVTNVILDRQIELERSSVKFDPQVVNTRTQSSLTSERTVGQRSPGEPSGATNTSNQQATITQPQGQELDKQHETEVQEGVPSYEQVVSKMAPLTPERVTVSVAVPRSYYRRVWEGRQQAGAREPTYAPEGTELEKIESEMKQKIHKAVVTLLHPRSGGQDDDALVQVSTFDDQTLAPPPGTGRVTQATSWLAENWSTLGMMAVGVAGLLVLRGMLRSAPTGAGPQAGIEETWSVLRPDQSDSHRGQAEGNRVKRGKRLAESDTSPREELAQMVNEDPEAAAAILRAWIGQTQ